MSERFGIQLSLLLGAAVAACSADPASSGTASGVTTAGIGVSVTDGGATTTGGTGATTGGSVTTTEGMGTTTGGGITTTSSAVTGAGVTTTDGGVTTTDSGVTTTGGGVTTTGGTGTMGGASASAGNGAGGVSGTTGGTTETTGTGGSGDDPLGPCGGTEDECEAARIINEYRAQHMNEGECNEPLRWSDKVGQLAHAHQESQGMSIAHSDHGYPENVGIASGLRETTEYIIQFEEGTEPHCNSNGSFSAGHHCTAMLCSTRTVGIGIVRDGERIAMTMMFGDENGDPGW